MAGCCFLLQEKHKACVGVGIAELQVGNSFFVETSALVKVHPCTLAPLELSQKAKVL